MPGTPTFLGPAVSIREMTGIMRRRLLPILLTLAASVLSCEQELGPLRTGPVGETLVGSWLLVERGHSPGSGYYTDPVPDEPPQYMTLHADHRLTSNIFTEYKYYRVLIDTAQDVEVVAFFRSDPGDKPVHLSNLEHSYTVRKEEEMLKLWYRYCFEGCHLGFRRLIEGSSD